MLSMGRWLLACEVEGDPTACCDIESKLEVHCPSVSGADGVGCEGTVNGPSVVVDVTGVGVVSLDSIGVVTAFDSEHWPVDPGVAGAMLDLWVRVI